MRCCVVRYCASVRLPPCLQERCRSARSSQIVASAQCIPARRTASRGQTIAPGTAGSTSSRCQRARSPLVGKAGRTFCSGLPDHTAVCPGRWHTSPRSGSHTRFASGPRTVTKTVIGYFVDARTRYKREVRRNGGSVWESNPPSRGLAPITGFEGQKISGTRYVAGAVILRGRRAPSLNFAMKIDYFWIMLRASRSPRSHANDAARDW